MILDTSAGSIFNRWKILQSNFLASNRVLSAHRKKYTKRAAKSGRNTGRYQKREIRLRTRRQQGWRSGIGNVFTAPVDPWLMNQMKLRANCEAHSRTRPSHCSPTIDDHLEIGCPASHGPQLQGLPILM
ncbi:uncharacterized protein LOC124416242 [Diprion similis]|uniref:uncharacterized protein LOC124416242 n=1 Tax=Diprion similis TaxID=362088 RepID=UPI001EF9701C|nr:uncharacterized protein LOC124416242 [Diprion similis]